MELTSEQVIKMAPDASSLAAGKKLSSLKDWKDLGSSAGALWGVCRGSADYQVRVDLANMGYACSCPSRKFPCKHVLGLLLIRAQSAAALPATDEPQWVVDWLSKRRQRDEKKAEKVAETIAGTEAAPERKPVDEAAQQKRMQQREARVQAGFNRLDQWLRDQVRNGLAGLETRSPSFWEDEAKRLVDAQAGGIAARVRRLASLPHSGKDWPRRMLDEFGKLKLLIHAWPRLEEFSPELRDEMRQLVGWTVAQAELEQRGELVQDQWLVIGQTVDDEDRIRAQRSWILGRQSQRIALILQFAPHGQPFAESIIPGTEQSAIVVFYPGISRQRAKFAVRQGTTSLIEQPPPGHATIADFLDSQSELWAKFPWLSSSCASICNVQFRYQNGQWHVIDSAGAHLELLGQSYWHPLAISGGHPLTLFGEWDGTRIRGLGFYQGDQYQPI